MKAIIVEDTPDALEYLKELVDEECPQIELIGEAKNLEEAEQLIKTQQPELVFLDIEMWGGMTSFDLLKKLEKEDALNFQIIFVTAHGNFNYAIKAMEYSALDYLTKPVERQKLREAVDKAVAKHKNREQWMQQMELLFESTGSRTAPKSIAIPLTKGAVEIVQPDEIAWLESRTEVTNIHLQNGETLAAMRNIGHFAKLLIPQFPFFQISQSAVVFIPYVRRYNHNELTVTLKNGQALFASRRGGQDFRQYLLNNEAGLLEEGNNQLKDMFRKLFR